ncbi:TfuA-like protein [uncultured Sphingomonas sp.]|uniref:TfuA-like protein n=1 Tax=uncultured Sphingomonas sp. TaxID=158754 RepID=UPI0035CA6E66
MIAGRIAVFAGPSLPPADRPPDARFEWLPPVTAGDLLRLLDRPPAIVCLIDGFFDRSPAPWHKEIMALTAHRVVVFGAASMGALRAAELHELGMIGVGAIFRAYRLGLLTGDDEVACLHAPGELGWTALTVPMVEVRATLAAAVRARALAAAAARHLRALIHDIHFTVRDWAMIERVSVGSALVTPDGFELLRSLYTPIKRMDAVACLSSAAAWDEQQVLRPPPPWTCYLDALAREVCAAATARSASTRAKNDSPAPRENG